MIVDDAWSPFNSNTPTYTCASVWPLSRQLSCYLDRYPMFCLLHLAFFSPLSAGSGLRPCLSDSPTDSMCLVSGPEHSNLSVYSLKEWVFLDASSLPSLEAGVVLGFVKHPVTLGMPGQDVLNLPFHYTCYKLVRILLPGPPTVVEGTTLDCSCYHPSAYWNHLENLRNVRALTHSSPISQGNSNIRITDFNPVILVLSRKVTYLDSWLLKVDINEYGGGWMWQQLVPDTKQQSSPKCNKYRDKYTSPLSALWCS